MIPVIAQKYAKAAFSVAKNNNVVDKFLADLELFAKNFSDKIAEELANPAISRKDMAEIIKEMSKKLSLHEKVTAFLVEVARSRRIKFVKQIYLAFSKLVKNDKNFLEVEVFSVDKLEDQKLSEIKSILQKKYPQKTIEINNKIKSDILGGVIIKINSLMIDASLKNQLSNLEKEFKSIL